MLFNSYVFIFVFLPVTFFTYSLLNKRHLRLAARFFLLLSSLFFYSWWNIYYVPLILVSILFNYVIGLGLSSLFKHKTLARSYKAALFLLTLGVVFNLALLGYYKYRGFFITNVNTLFEQHYAVPDIILPLAISFFTFQQIAYLVDSYKGEVNDNSFLNYALFVSFFPQLIAGPIVHHKKIIPQLLNLKNSLVNYQHIAQGVFLFSIGLFKKVVLADSLSSTVHYGFDSALSLDFYTAWASSLAYTLQLYFDFSGYTDMAIGLALLFNIRLPANFNSPYKAKTIQQFWQCWHMTLSQFLRDYVYIPLGGNQYGTLRTYTNLMLTFIVGGLWHGAAWTFIFWGVLHGAAMLLHRVWKASAFSMPTLLAWFLTFNFINISWVFFRADDWSDAIKVLSAMFNFSSVDVSFSWSLWITSLSANYNNLVIFFSLLCVLFLPNSLRLLDYFKTDIKWLVFISGLLFFSLMSLQIVESEFLYFNF